tara:strand:- start:10425 stop:10625 length:201 start_codon:yes stop_codon:yes gene_type:complete
VKGQVKGNVERKGTGPGPEQQRQAGVEAKVVRNSPHNNNNAGACKAVHLICDFPGHLAPGMLHLSG